MEIRDSYDDSSDDDLMIISKEAASPEAREKWQQHQYPHMRKEDVPIKPEPSTRPASSTRAIPAFVTRSPPTPVDTRTSFISAPATPPAPQSQLEKVLAAQRRLLSRNNGVPKVVAGNSSGWRDEPEGSGSRNHRYETPNINPIYRESREDAEQVDTAMIPGDEDNSWMEQDDDDDEFDRISAEIVQLKKKKKLSQDEDMRLYRLETQLQVQRRLRIAADRRASVGDRGLFLTPEPEDRRETIQRHRRNARASQDLNGDDGIESDQVGDDAALAAMLHEELNGGGLRDGPESSPQGLGLTKSGKPRKRRAKNAREIVAQEEERRENERKKVTKKVR